MISKIFGDMSAIRNNLTDYLNDDYFWPVSEHEFEDFSKFMHVEYINITKKENNSELSDIAIVEFSFVKQLLQILHYNYVKKYAEINNLELVFGTDAEQLFNPNWINIGLYYSSLKPQHNKLLRLMRRVVRNIVFNKHLPLFRIIYSLLFGSNSTSVGSNDQIKREFIKKNKVFYDHVDWPDLLDKNTDILDSHNEFKTVFLNKIIKPYLKKLMESSSLFVKDVDFEKITEAWSTRALEAYLLYTRFKSFSKSSELLITEISKPIGKLITVSYQSRGCKVYCFHHGNDVVATIQNQTFSMNVSQCNKFVIPTSGIVSRYKKHYSNVNRISPSCTEFLSVNSRKMYDLYLKNLNNSINKHVETVMLIGYPFNANRYVGGRGLFFYQQVDLEYRLISLLKSENKRVIYKAHPERLKEIEGVFDAVVDEIIVEPFEGVWNKADLLLFTYSSTTTFGYALTTNIPIILLDSEHEMRDKDDMLLLDKRVSRVFANISHNTRISFDKESLVDAMTRSTEDISFDYVKDIYKESYIAE
jgi:hypothetical protein